MREVTGSNFQLENISAFEQEQEVETIQRREQELFFPLSEQFQINVSYSNTIPTFQKHSSDILNVCMAQRETQM